MSASPLFRGQGTRAFFFLTVFGFGSSSTSLDARFLPLPLPATAAGLGFLTSTKSPAEELAGVGAVTAGLGFGAAAFLAAFGT